MLISLLQNQIETQQARATTHFQTMSTLVAQAFLPVRRVAWRRGGSRVAMLGVPGTCSPACRRASMPPVAGRVPQAKDARHSAFYGLEGARSECESSCRFATQPPVGPPAASKVSIAKPPGPRLRVQRFVMPYVMGG
jgi:hypothetical protein